MKIVNVSISNFMSIGQAQFSLDDIGLWLVQGENKDDTSQNSNGAGKSSIVEAICWALFGETSRNESGDEVINSKIGKDCYVSLMLEDSTDVYLITRHRKDTSYKNQLVMQVQTHGGWEDITKGTTDLTQKDIETIVGCSYEVFRAAIYMGQEEQVDLPAMTDKQLKTVVEEAAGIEQLQRAEELANLEYKETMTATQLATQRQESYKNVLVDKINDLDAAILRRVTEADAHRNYQIDLDTRIVNAELEEKQIKDGLMFHPSLSDLDDAIAEHSHESAAKVAACNANIATLDEQIARYIKAETVLGVKIRDLEKQIKTTEATSLALDKQAVCDACGAPMTNEHAAEYKAELTERIDGFKSELEEATNTLAKVRTEISALVEKRDKELAARPDVSSIAARIALLNSQRDQVIELLHQQDLVQARLKNLITDLIASKLWVNPHEATVTNLENEIEAIKRQIEAGEAELTSLNHKLAVGKVVLSVFGREGVRAHVLDTVTPYLNDRTAHYLSTLSDGNIQAVWQTLDRTKKGEIKEKFNISVVSKTGASRYKSLSGGEKRKVRLACSMALQDLVASRATKPINLFIGDEIDHALDGSGLERLMSILEEKAKERGSVLVISHNELGDWIRDVMKVVKSGGISHLEDAPTLA